MTRRGFTLLEAVVVLLLLGVVTAVAVPAFAGSAAASDPVVEGADSVSALLDRARRTAVERGRAVELLLDPSTGRYVVEAMHGAAPDSIAADSLRLPPEVRLESSAPRVRVVFHAAGGASAPPLVVRAADRAIALRVDPWTGAVHATP